MIEVEFKTLDANAKIPQRMSEEAAGWDLFASVEAPFVLAPGKRGLIPTGLAIAIPSGYEGQVRPRSGLAFKHGVTVLNAPGTIDSDYRGEVKVLLANLGDMPFTIEAGDRIAQLVIARTEAVRWQAVSELSVTVRAEGGFGSTGVATASPRLEENIL